MSVDVTDQVEFEGNDDECLPITKCVCGARFGAWEFVINIYEDMAHNCPVCGKKLYFRASVRVYEVEE